ncbi:MAG: glycosyltransferase family 2 protein [Brevinemataceae bacterium]
MQNPLLSIIIPVYNVEKYLPQCIESVLNQTYQNIEIIIINDCSPANEEKIILTYTTKYKNIRYITHTKNLGLGGARNTGINHAQGEYITFLDSDDWIEKNAYSNVLQQMLQHKANLGIFSVVNFNDHTKYTWFDKYFAIPFTSATLITSKNLSLINTTAWNKIYKTSDIKKHHLAFPEHLKHEDEEFWFKYAAKVKPYAVFDNSKYVHYRQRTNSITSQRSLSRKDTLQILKNIYLYLKKEHLFKEYRLTFENLMKFSLVPWYFETALEYRIEFVKETQELFTLLTWDIDDVFAVHNEFMIFYTTNPKFQDKILELCGQYKIQKNHHIKEFIVAWTKKLHIYPILKKIYFFIKR